MELPRLVELSFPGTFTGFEQAFARLRGALDDVDLQPATRFNVELVFEEIVANIVRYGGEPDRELAVSVWLELNGESIVLTFRDNGRPFDPRERADPAPPTSLEDARVGGLGVMLVRRVATGLDYCRTSDEHNQLIVTLAAKPRALS